MFEFLLGFIVGWIFARSYKKLKVDLQDIVDDLKSLTNRFREVD